MPCREVAREDDVGIALNDNGGGSLQAQLELHVLVLVPRTRFAVIVHTDTSQ